MKNVTAYIGFGANLADPVQQILDARRLMILADGLLSLESSSLYLTSPLGYVDQADFVNCVSRVNTTLSALELLDLCQSIEISLGRERNPENQNAARLIDLDILLFANKQINTDNLIVPHPRLKERLFVLEPLNELTPNLVISSLGKVSDMLRAAQENDAFANQTVYCLG